MSKTTGGLRKLRLRTGGWGGGAGQKRRAPCPLERLVRVASAGTQPVRLFNDASASQRETADGPL